MIHRYSTFLFAAFFAFAPATIFAQETKSDTVISISYEGETSGYTSLSRAIGFGRTSKTDNPKMLPLTINGPLVHKDGSSVGSILEASKDGKTFEHIDACKTTPLNKFSNFKYKNAIFGLEKTANGPKLSITQMSDWNFSAEKGKECKNLEEAVETVKEKKYHWAFQNGPALLIDGDNPHNASSTSRSIRTGLGFTSDQKIIYIKSGQKVTFYEFAELFTNLDIGIKNAIYLDGLDENVIGYSLNTSPVKVDPMDAKASGYEKDRLLIQFYHAKAELLDVQ